MANNLNQAKCAHDGTPLNDDEDNDEDDAEDNNEDDDEDTDEDVLQYNERAESYSHDENRVGQVQARHQVCKATSCFSRIQASSRHQ